MMSAIVRSKALTVILFMKYPFHNKCRNCGQEQASSCPDEHLNITGAVSGELP